MGSTQTDIGAIGIELFGVFHRPLQGLLVIHLKIVVDDDLKLIDIKELRASLEHGILEVEHQLAFLVVKFVVSIVVHRDT